MVGANDNDQGSSQTSSKRMRRKSVVWEHFTVESLGGGCTRACCKRCKQTFAYSSGSKFAGTSHLKRHLALGICPKNRHKEKNQLTPYTPPAKNGGSVSDPPKRRYKGSPSVVSEFDQDRSRQDIAKMIIVHEYPLHIVEHSGFITFVQNLQPQFKMVTFSTVEADCLAIYQKEKQNLMQLMGTIPGRISLTLDLWTSSQTLGYMCVTGQFIDSDWRLHRRILNFMVVSSQTGNILTDAIGTCLSNWNMENKLFSITLDNGSSNDGISSNLRDYLSNKNALVLNGQLFVASFAHILNLVVKDGLGAIHDIVYKIRESIKYVKTSPAHEEKFAEVVKQFQIPSMRSPSLDVQTQWNTTFLMLLAALEHKQAFVYLETCDSNYMQAPTVDEWKKVETLCKYLKVLYDAANVFTGMPNPTANIYFHEVWKIKLELSHATTSEDPFTRSVVGLMHEKFDGYWKDCCLILAIAVIMDPRFKMKLVEFSYTKIYGENAGTCIKTVNDGIHDLYLEYIAQPLPLTPAYIEQGPAPNNGGMEGGTLLTSGDGLLDFDVFISEMSSNQQTKSELDQYLEESLLPRIQEFDILEWWKLNKLKYPTLSKMARDVLAISMSTVSSEFIFSTESRVLDDYRSTLRPETLQAVVCAKDWLQQQNELVEPSAIVKMEF
ncbi:zinc finger BED domain-containing protein RICESLEEPER 2 [Magnolia sinica]|uniref:zinc finger BED domain-containing protein RICESLEEPER 2 n=1 Tax=Magnolia sinica TaxID=86752 RepID=UPI002657D36C|nr:zinc finger BED domain-containing protein RICESLEEPER 2 [Magnolia sinica]XP_058112093.1 zinc finger BED domain-containing protein RICESLEEPER 2 [Magnolia sinica]